MVIDMTMDVNFMGEKSLDPAIWDYMINRFGRVRNPNYESITVDVDGNTQRQDDTIISNQNNVLFYFNGVETSLVKENIDLINKEKNTEIIMPLTVFDNRAMRKNKWKPVYNSDKKVILMWVKPPYVVSCVNLKAVPVSKSVKKLIDFFYKQISMMGKPVIHIDYSKVERELGSLISSIKNKQFRQFKEEVADLQYEINDLQKRIVSRIAEIRDKEQLLDSKKSDARKDIDVKNTIKSLLNMKNVKYITVENGKVVIVTEPMYSKPFHYGKKRRIYLGSFKISWGDGTPIKIKNLEKHPDIRCDHPHVRDGVPCWGNMAEISSYAQKFDVEIVAQLVLSYLEHVNPTGWHTDGVEWEKYFRDGRRD